MKELSRREFYLVLICPGLVLVALYLFFVESSSRDSIRQLEHSQLVLQRSLAGLDLSITAARKTPLPPIFAAKQESKSLANQIEVEHEIAALNAHPWRLAPARWTTPAGRINALHAVASIFESNDLTVVKRQADANSKKVLPLELESFAVGIVNDGNHPVPEIWRVDVVGSYGDLLAALNQLGRSDVFVIPLAVTMDVLPGVSPSRSWTLWLWV